MAVYKVPQDVEADDKLLGPFSFRQFLYLIVATMGVALAWGFSTIALPLAIVPMPIVIFFAVLALPLRKDQPMEVYIAALISFYLKPRRRLWKADGVQSLIEIVVPKTIEERRTKDFSDTEAEKRLSYLASLVDSRGWAVRGVEMPQADNAMRDDVFFEAQQTEDVLDKTSTLTHTFDSMIDKAETQRRQAAINTMTQPAPAAPQPTATPVISPAVAATPQTQTQVQPAPAMPTEPVVFNPYPSSMHQRVIQPTAVQPIAPPQPAQPQSAPAPTSNSPVSAGIINLANNSDLSIETMAHEAKRIRENEGSSDGEVVISLR